MALCISHGYIIILAYLILIQKYQVVVAENCVRYLPQPSNNSQKEVIVGDESSAMCPPWYWLGENGTCQRGSTLYGIVDFDSGTGQTSLQGMYCMTTHGDTTNRTDIIGGCLPSYYSLIHHSYQLPCNISQLNKFMCADWNREGQLCGRCMKGFAPPVYSYSLACVNCTDYHLNWLKYIGVAFGPLTLFCLLICFFHISATSPYLHGFVFFCQIITSSPMLRLGVNSNLFNTSVNSPSTVGYSKLYVTLINIWNLDFLVVIYKPFCLHPNMTVLQALAFNYLIGFYPILLLLVVYLLVKLHSRNVAVIVALWKPFRVFHRPFLRNLNVQTSLIESFATLYFLSAMKIQSVTIDLLAPTPLYFANGTVSKNMYLYLAGDMEYFGSEHALYGIMALFFFVTFTLVPGLLLFLYPYRFFQQFLNKIRCNFVTLKIFMDVFQGNYKDGTNNTRDYRFFSGIFFFIRFLLSITFYIINSRFFLIISGTILTMLGFSVAVVHPQRRYISYFLDCFILMILSLFLFSVIGIAEKSTNYLLGKVAHIFLNIAVVLPLLFLYFIGLMGYWTLIKKRIPQSCANFMTKKMRSLFTLLFSQQNSRSGYRSLQEHT